MLFLTSFDDSRTICVMLFHMIQPKLRTWVRNHRCCLFLLTLDWRLSDGLDNVCSSDTARDWYTTGSWACSFLEIGELYSLEWGSEMVFDDQKCTFLRGEHHLACYCCFRMSLYTEILPRYSAFSIGLLLPSVQWRVSSDIIAFFPPSWSNELVFITLIGAEAQRVRDDRFQAGTKSVTYIVISRISPGATSMRLHLASICIRRTHLLLLQVPSREGYGGFWCSGMSNW